MGTTPSQIEVLQAFARDPAAVSVASTASVIVRVVREAASADGASKEAVKSARLALLELCKHPRLEALSDLLEACENEVSLDIVDVFMLSSVAWKAVVATSIKFGAGDGFADAAKLQVVNSAVRGAQKAVHEMMRVYTTHGRGGDKEAAGRAAGRSLKIARFHCANAARCSMAFAEKGLDGRACYEQAAAAGGHVMWLVAVVTFIASFDSAVVELLRIKVRQDLAPVLGSILRSLARMCASVKATESDDEVDPFALKCLQAMTVAIHEDDNDDNDENGPPSASVELLAILYVLRHLPAGTFVPPTCMDEEPITPLQPKALAASHKMLRSFLLPKLFTCLDEASANILSLRELQSGLLLQDIVSRTVNDCVAVIRLQCMTCCQSESTVLGFLLQQVTKQNPLRAYVAQNAILHVTSLLPASSTEKEQLLQTVLLCARSALVFRTGHGERRWVPLASALAIGLLKEGKSLQDVFCQYQRAARLRAYSPPDKGKALTWDDPVVLRILASLCGLLMLEESDPGGEAESPQPAETGTDVVDRILEATRMDRAALTCHVKAAVLGNARGGVVHEAAIQLLPYLIDERASSGAALACLKRDSSSLPTKQRALNILNPAVMSSSGIQMVCAHASTTIRALGHVICAPVAAFVARAALALHDSVSLTDWQHLSSLLEQAITVARGPESGEWHISALTEAAVSYHAVAALRAARSRSENRNLQATLPDSILRITEEAKERMHRLRAPDSRLVKDEIVREETAVVEKESALFQGHQRAAGGGIGADGEELLRQGLERIRQEVLRITRQVGATESASQAASAGVKEDVRELREMVGVLEGILEP